MNFQFTKGYIVSFLCFLLGAYLCFSGLQAYYNKNSAIPLNMLSYNNFKEGDYVSGYIESYVHSGNDSFKGETYYGSSETFVSMSGVVYEMYTLPIAGNYYIRFSAATRDTIEALINFTFDQQDHFYIEGKIVRTDKELNDAWYENSKEFHDRDFRDVIIKDFLISEINFDQQIGKAKYGLLFLLASIVMFFLFGGVNNFVQVGRFGEEYRSRKKLQYSYRTEYELEEEKRHLSLLYNRLNKLKKGCLYRLPLLFAGLWMVLRFYHVGIKLLGIVCIFLSIRALLQYFFNSNINAALFIVKSLHWNSVWLQIMESNKKIHVLQNLIEEHEASKDQPSDIN